MKKDKELKILCIWCNAVWTAEMELKELWASQGCSSCGYGNEGGAKIEITCGNCGKVVYQKAFDKENF